MGIPLNPIQRIVKITHRVHGVEEEVLVRGENEKIHDLIINQNALEKNLLLENLINSQNLLLIDKQKKKKANLLLFLTKKTTKQQKNRMSPLKNERIRTKINRLRIQVIVLSRINLNQLKK